MKNRLKVVASLAVTAFFLWFALHDVDWHEVWENVRRANWLLLALSALVGTLSIHVRALRWKPLLAPVDPNVALQPRIASTAIGFAANNLIPARVGEVVRAVVCARLAKLPVSAVFASLVVERVLDGLVTVALLFLTLSLPGFPSPEKAQGVLTALRVMALMMGVAAVVMIVLAMMPKRSLALGRAFADGLLPQRMRAPAVKILEGFISGLAVLRNPRLLAVSVAFALGQWLFMASAIYFAFLAFGIREPGYVGAVFLQCGINLAVAFPSAPGFFGPLEAAAKVGLSLWGVDASRAISFAIGFHMAGFLAVTLLGLWYVQRLNLSWGELIGTAKETAEEGDAGAPPGTEPRRA